MFRQGEMECYSFVQFRLNPYPITESVANKKIPIISDGESASVY